MVLDMLDDEDAINGDGDGDGNGDCDEGDGGEDADERQNRSDCESPGSSMVMSPVPP